MILGKAIAKIKSIDNKILMQCPECPKGLASRRKSTHINKNGKKKGKQNYICVECGRQFLDCYQVQRGYCEQLKRECITMYVNGMGLRALARVQGISHVTIINWVKQVGELLPDAYHPEVIPQVGELDELETFVGSKSGATPLIFNQQGNPEHEAGQARTKIKQALALDSCRSFPTRYFRLGFRRS